MRVSVVVPVLNSHEVVRRQALFFKRMDLPDDVEIVYVDDGSEPAHVETYEVRNFRIVWTFDKRPWTWALARNKGARVARGEWLLMVDLDYVVTRECIDACGRWEDVDYMGFRREFGVLTESGELTQSREALLEYGLPEERWRTKGTLLPAHTNQFAIRRGKFFEMGGYREDRVGLPYPQGEDNDWRKKRKRWQAAGKLRVLEDRLRETLFMFPNGRWCGDVDFNPFGLFHELSRKSVKNPFRERQPDGSVGYRTS